MSKKQIDDKIDLSNRNAIFDLDEVFDFDNIPLDEDIVDWDAMPSLKVPASKQLEILSMLNSSVWDHDKTIEILARDCYKEARELLVKYEESEEIEVHDYMPHISAPNLLSFYAYRTFGKVEKLYNRLYEFTTSKIQGVYMSVSLDEPLFFSLDTIRASINEILSELNKETKYLMHVAKAQHITNPHMSLCQIIEEINAFRGKDVSLGDFCGLNIAHEIYQDIMCCVKNRNGLILGCCGSLHPCYIIQFNGFLDNKKNKMTVSQFNILLLNDYSKRLNGEQLINIRNSIYTGLGLGKILFLDVNLQLDTGIIPDTSMLHKSFNNSTIKKTTYRPILSADHAFEADISYLKNKMGIEPGSENDKLFIVFIYECALLKDYKTFQMYGIDSERMKRIFASVLKEIEVISDRIDELYEKTGNGIWNQVYNYCKHHDFDFASNSHNVLVVYKLIKMQLNEKGILISSVIESVHTLPYDEEHEIQAIGTNFADLSLFQNSFEKMDCTFHSDYECKKFDTLSLWAAIDILTGEVVPFVSDDQKSSDFVEFLKKLNEKYPTGDMISITLDFDSSHTSEMIQEYLNTIPGRFEFLFTSRHESWMNIVRYFGDKMIKQMLLRIKASSKEELKKLIYQYLDELNY